MRAPQTDSRVNRRAKWLLDSPLLLFVVILLLAALPIAIFTIRTDRMHVTETISDQAQESRNLSNLSAALIEEHFQQNSTLLSSYATDPELKAEWKRNDLNAVRARMERALKLQPDASLVSIYTLDGTLRAIAPENQG